MVSARAGLRLPECLACVAMDARDQATSGRKVALVQDSRGIQHPQTANCGQLIMTVANRCLGYIEGTPRLGSRHDPPTRTNQDAWPVVDPSGPGVRKRIRNAPGATPDVAIVP
jgi:hypothetical protein